MDSCPYADSAPAASACPRRRCDDDPDRPSVPPPFAAPASPAARPPPLADSARRLHTHIHRLNATVAMQQTMLTASMTMLIVPGGGSLGTIAVDGADARAVLEGVPWVATIASVSVGSSVEQSSLHARQTGCVGAAAQQRQQSSSPPPVATHATSSTISPSSPSPSPSPSPSSPSMHSRSCTSRPLQESFREIQTMLRLARWGGASRFDRLHVVHASCEQQSVP
mmetsp:Transcript_8063/g.25770  ORF Transcript_8063/g.25770 Transcript_8063/m.25770 type:complete len:224 (-) Transcript_8063:109-780(-)